jgi:hypothetical protein
MPIDLVKPLTDLLGNGAAASADASAPPADADAPADPELGSLTSEAARAELEQASAELGFELGVGTGTAGEEVQPPLERRERGKRPD